MEIEIRDTNVESRKGNSDKGPWEMRMQQALLWRTGEEFPDKFKIRLNNDEPPMQPGKYAIHPSSYVINGNGGLELSRYNMVYMMISDSKGKVVGNGN